MYNYVGKAAKAVLPTYIMYHKMLCVHDVCCINTAWCLPPDLLKLLLMKKPPYDSMSTIINDTSLL